MDVGEKGKEKKEEETSLEKPHLTKGGWESPTEGERRDGERKGEREKENEEKESVKQAKIGGKELRVKLKRMTEQDIIRACLRKPKLRLKRL